MTAPETADIGRLIEEMGAEVEEGPPIYRPSRFWEIIGGLNAAQLDDLGFASFKRTINNNYFNWLVAHPRDSQFRALMKEWLRHPTLAVASARLLNWAGVESERHRRKVFTRRRTRLGYAVFVALLWDYVRRQDRLGLLDRLEEPALGDPILVRHRGRLVSQDLANSFLELSSILEAFPNGIPEGATVVELGGGYGRLGWLLLSVVPGVRYVAVDIPPALAVAQEYLTRLFPELRTVRFQRGTDHLAPTLPSARLAFVTPNQLEGLPPLEADLFINISSLHEMRPAQIAHYLCVAGRHTGGVFYMKQYRTFTNDDDGVTIRQADYPIPASWARIFERRHPVQTLFFEAAYRVR